MKKVLYGAVLAALAVILAAVIWFTGSGGSRIREGTYRIQNCEKYPDAYIVVKDDTIQLFNFDLNAEFREKTYQGAMKMKELNFDMVQGLTDEELYELCDLNSVFSSTPYRITEDYTMISKDGSFKYDYNLFGGFSLLHIGLEYDTFHGKLTMNNEYEFIR